MTITLIECFRVLYDKMITPLHNLLKNGPESHHTLELGHKFYEQNLEKTATVYYNINRFLSAFIDHVSSEDERVFIKFYKFFYLQGLKDLEYIVQEKSFIENVLEFEFSSNNPDSKCKNTDTEIFKKKNYLEIDNQFQYFVHSSRCILSRLGSFL